MSTVFEVTLTQKKRLEVQAETPEDALRIAQEKTAGSEFNPTAWSVKESND